jgi:hypothetical protein
MVGMATRMNEAGVTRAEADVDAYVGLLSELDESLKAERDAHKRLVALARKIEKQDERRRRAAN